jgi:hypothetical protein
VSSLFEPVTRVPPWTPSPSAGWRRVEKHSQQCHLCGQWHRALGSHLRRHGWTADEYRRAAGLSPRRPLQSPSVSRRQAANARALADRDPRVRAGLAAGVERARAGELLAAGTAVRSRELARPQLFELRRRQGRDLGMRQPSVPRLVPQRFDQCPSRDRVALEIRDTNVDLVLLM